MFATKLLFNFTLLLLFLVQHVHSKVCHTGVEGDCPKGQSCYSQKHEPGSPGTCGKDCMTGTTKGCPKGQECEALTSLPGGPGVCIAKNQCATEKRDLNDMQDELVDHLYSFYDHFMTPMMKDLFEQVVNSTNGLKSCGGNDGNDCGEGNFCFYEPAVPFQQADGHCYKYDPSWGYCLFGNEQDNCPSKQKCIARPGAPDNTLGICVPDASKKCISGTKNACGKGQICLTLPGSPPGSDGYCIPEDNCWPEDLFMMYIQYWQFENTRLSYKYDLDIEHQKKLKEMVLKA